MRGCPGSPGAAPGPRPTGRPPAGNGAATRASGGGTAGRGRTDRPPSGAAAPGSARPGPALRWELPRGGGGRARPGTRGGSARSPGSGFGKRNGSGSCRRPGASASLAVPIDDHPSVRLWCLLVCPVGGWWALGGVRHQHLARTHGSGCSSPSVFVCPLREPADPVCAHCGLPAAPPAAAPARGTVAEHCGSAVCAIGTARATFSHLPERVSHCAGERFPSGPACSWKASMCNAGLWAGPRGRGERRGERGAIRGRPSPRRPWPRGTGGLREQMLKGSLAGCDA